uniref:Uncharacterized protein n=1 Tax=Poecilia reticulata TaxID=8081 RepID=A0A3P9Q3T5_POERE
VSPPGHVLGPDGFLDAVHLLLVALAVACRVLLGLLQTQAPFSGSPASKSVKKNQHIKHLLLSFSSQLMVFLRVLFFSFSLSYFCFHCSAVSSMFTVTVFLMVFSVLLGYLCPNIRVDLVSASL